ncbi:ADC synthase [Calycina marina]|uniref:aminodeoxychorismate synthase n=1 Tax=Calycina marina TaxID=1763456 RepID=A0A9P7Z5J3_9HELO|nr:ADC synthase [Calycina marina]
MHLLSALMLAFATITLLPTTVAAPLSTLTGTVLNRSPVINTRTPSAEAGLIGVACPGGSALGCSIKHGREFLSSTIKRTFTRSPSAEAGLIGVACPGGSALGCTVKHGRDVFVSAMKNTFARSPAPAPEAGLIGVACPGGSALGSPKPLILFIDAYDSFSNNIISLLETELAISTRTIKIDDPTLCTDEAFHAELSHYAAVVCGPGPGHPGNEEDVGIMRRIWRLGNAQMLPVLGICLGFQSLCLELGAEVKRLRGPQHGMIRKVTHAEGGRDGTSYGGDIFAGVGEVLATLYHSLCVDVGQDSISEAAWISAKWKASSACPDLVPLAWVGSDGSKNDSGIVDNRVLVAARHVTKPFWALQYHPESICTNKESKKVIRNWWELAQSWNRDHRATATQSEHPIQGSVAVRQSLLASSKQVSHPASSRIQSLPDFGLSSQYHFRTIKLGHYVSVPEIMEALGGMDSDQIMLESSNSQDISPDVRGRFSIVALDVTKAPSFRYIARSHRMTICLPSRIGNQVSVDVRPYGGIWGFLAIFLNKRRLTGNVNMPFWGGFMGFTTYELGLETIGVESKSSNARSGERPDLCFAWITRSLVVDHVNNCIYVQVLTENNADIQWLEAVSSRLNNISLPESRFLGAYLGAGHPSMRSESAKSSTTSLSTPPSPGQTPVESARTSIFSPDIPKATADALPNIFLPSETEYETKVSRCQDHIRAGDSYELCLTDQTLVQTPASDAWLLYRKLRSHQPAPFASYVRLGGATLVSSSPERFLKYDADGNCELRPMKGTVRKTPEISTLADAIPFLDIPKEKAENLMIVDLVRHDLHSVCGSGMVEVPRLMVVEEYRSVFQMISVVQGQITKTESGENNYTGLDVLAASLPPGSMTGAPKKRSCEILQDVEKRERGMYSGVVGYMDVGGRGDWSVTIRCMFKWDDEDVISPDNNGVEKTTETWHIGAGGAVTILSTPRGEREEMLTKLNGTLGVFG